MPALSSCFLLVMCHFCIAGSQIPQMESIFSSEVNCQSADSSVCVEHKEGIQTVTTSQQFADIMNLLSFMSTNEGLIPQRSFLSQYIGLKVDQACINELIHEIWYLNFK